MKTALTNTHLDIEHLIKSLRTKGLYCERDTNHVLKLDVDKDKVHSLNVVYFKSARFYYWSTTFVKMVKAQIEAANLKTSEVKFNFIETYDNELKMEGDNKFNAGFKFICTLKT